jgi:adenosylhomocysteine nucleosidase
MAILFVASEAFELKPLAEQLTGLRPLKWPLRYAVEGVWNGKRYLLTANGPGPKLAARCVEVALRASSMAELSASKLEAVVSTGLCGATEPSLQVKDIVEATEVFSLDDKQRFPCSAASSAAAPRRGVVVSANRVAGTAAEKQKLQQTTNAIAVEMEAAGVAQRATASALPFACIKVVSDRADEEFVMDFNQLRSPEGHFSRGKIVAYALAHPGTIPRLISLRSRSQEAARALGAFLASCTFQFSTSPLEGEVSQDG